MDQPIAVRRDFTAIEVRLARRAKDSDQVRRLLAIAAVLDGAFPGGGRRGRRDGPADASGLGDPVQRARA